MQQAFSPLTNQARQLVHVLSAIWPHIWTEAEIEAEFERLYPDDAFQRGRGGGLRNLLQRHWPGSSVYKKERVKGLPRAPLIERPSKARWRLASDWRAYMQDEPIVVRSASERRPEPADLAVLMARYAAASRPTSVPRKKATVTRYDRFPLVVQIAKMRAGFQCEVPGCLHPPIQMEDGRDYVEVHHIDGLGDGGPDTPENTAAVCAHHHAEITRGCYRRRTLLNQQLRELRLRELSSMSEAAD